MMEILVHIIAMTKKMRLTSFTVKFTEGLMNPCLRLQAERKETFTRNPMNPFPHPLVEEKKKKALDKIRYLKHFCFQSFSFLYLVYYFHATTMVEHINL